MLPVAYAALCVFIFSIPWENVAVLPGFGVISQLTGILAAAIAMLAIVVTGRIRRWQLFHVAAMLFVVWAACIQLFFHLGDRLPHKFWTFVQLFVMVWMIWEVSRSAQRQLGLLTAYVFGASVSAFQTIRAYHAGAGKFGRFAAEGFDANDLAMTLALALPMAWYLGMTYRKPLLRWLCRAYLPLGLLAIGLTGSRGGMLASVVALLIVPLSMSHLSPGRLATMIAVLGLSGALAVAYVPDTLVKRLASTGTNISELSFGGRFRLWVAGVNAFTQRPLVGYGTGAFKQAITPQLGDLSQVAHDTFISVLVEEGLVGLLFYLLMLAAAFRAVLRLAHLERRFALVITGTLIVAMLPLTWEDKKPVWFILASLVGLSQTAVVVRVPVLGQPRRLRPAVVPSQSPEPLASPASGRSREL